jgi:phenylacetate-coenzyme A ligase PaaK-like adenylate-forming protein
VNLDIDLTKIVLDSCSKLYSRCMDDSQLLEKLGVELIEFIKPENLKLKLERELGTDFTLDLRRIDYKRDLFEGWASLGTILHIAPSNASGLAFLAALEGLLTGNKNIVKLGSRDDELSAIAFEELFECDSTGLLRQHVSIVKLSSSDPAFKKILSQVDAISVWGGDAAISAIKSEAPAGVRIIPWGHKISFAYVSKKKLSDNEAIALLAEDCVLLEQQACSSPQCLFVEVENFSELCSFSEKFAECLKRESDKVELPQIDIQEQAEITNVIELAKLDSLMGESKVIEAEDKSWRVIAENRSVLSPSPLYRSVWIRPLLRGKIIECLRPWRTYLQTVGLLSSENEMGELLQLFIKAGATRLTTAGKMLDSYTGEPHDGEVALSRFLKRVRAELPGIGRISRLSELQNKITPNSDDNCPEAIMSKEDFQKQKASKEKSQLFFRSGGSSGKPAISSFSYNDYHKQMQAAAEGLYAAGLEPDTDRAMNLFFGGSLYGGFVSFFTILESLRVRQYPMAAYDDLKLVGQFIVDHDVNVLLGMPSYLMQLLEANKEILKESKCLEKVFYGGEHFSKKQQDYLKKEFGISIIRSACYGSVDAGPLGFQCSSCAGSVHHLNVSLHKLEILKLDEDCPVDSEEIGRLVFSTPDREAVSISRYDLGDIGRWVEEDCPCGRKAKRFELLGRKGDIFRSGGTFVNFQILEKLAREEGVVGEIQVKIDNENGEDRVSLQVENKGELDSDSIRKSILNGYKEFKQANIDEGGFQFRVLPVRSSELDRTAGSGKLIRVLDGREFK